MRSCSRVLLLVAFLLVGCQGEHIIRVWNSPGFIRGDVDENMVVEMSDAMDIYRYAANNVTVQFECMDAADVDDDGVVDTLDAFYILRFCYVPGFDPPPPPYPECGVDRTEDELGCRCHPCMRGGNPCKGAETPVAVTAPY